MWSSFDQGSSTSHFEKRGIPSPLQQGYSVGKKIETKSSNQNENKHYYYHFYNEAYFQNMRSQYNDILQSLATPNSFPIDHCLEKLQEIRSTILGLFSHTNDDANEGNSYFIKWKQLLFLIQKMILKTQSQRITSPQNAQRVDKDSQNESGEKSDQPEENSLTILTTTTDKQQYYLLAIENFELMLDLYGSSSEIDLVMVQLLLFWSIQCEDYWTFQNILYQYSSKFNQFYRQYLQEQWKLLSTLPICHSKSLQHILDSAEGGKDDDDHPMQLIPDLSQNEVEKAIAVYAIMLQLLHAEMDTSEFVSKEVWIIIAGKLRNETELLQPSEQQTIEENTNSNKQNGDKSTTRRMPTRQSNVYTEESNDLEDGHSSSSNNTPGKLLESKLRSSFNNSDEPSIAKLEGYFFKYAENYPSINQYFDPDYLTSRFPWSEAEGNPQEVENQEEEIEEEPQNNKKDLEGELLNTPSVFTSTQEENNSQETEVFTHLLNEIIHNLNRNRHSNNNIHYQDLLSFFILASSELISLIFKNRTFYFHYIIKENKELAHILQHSFAKILLRLVATLIRHYLPASSSLFVTFNDSYLLRTNEEIRKLQLENLKLLLKEVCLDCLVIGEEEGVEEKTNHVATVHSKEQMKQEAQKILHEIVTFETIYESSTLNNCSNNHEIITQSKQVDALVAIRKQWCSVFYLFYQSSLIKKINSTAEEGNNNKKSKRKKENCLLHASLYNEIPEFIKRLETSAELILQFHQQYQGKAVPDSGEGVGNDQVSMEYYYLLPHLSRYHYHFLTPSIILSITSKLMKYFTSQYELFQHYFQEHCYRKEANLFLPSNDAKTAARKKLSANSSLEDLEKWIDEAIRDFALSESSTSSNPVNLKPFLFHIEMNEKMEEFVLCKALVKVTAQIKLLNREKGVSNEMRLAQWKNRGKQISFASLQLLQQALRAITEEASHGKKEREASKEGTGTELLSNIEELNPHLASYWRCILRQYKVLFKSITFDPAEMKNMLRLLLLLLPNLLKLLTNPLFTSNDSNKTQPLILSEGMVTIGKGILLLLQHFLIQENVQDSTSTTITGLNDDDDYISSLLCNIVQYHWFTMISTSKLDSISLGKMLILVDYFNFLIEKGKFQGRILETEMNIIFILSLFYGLKQTMVFAPASSELREELTIKILILICLLLSENQEIRSHLDGTKPPSVNRIDFYRLGVDNIFSVLFPSRFEGRGEGGRGSMIPCDYRVELKIFERYLSQILHPLIYDNTNPYSLPLTVIKEGYVLLGRIYSFLYTIPLVFTTTTTTENEKEQEDDGDHENERSVESSEETESQTTDTNEDSDDDTIIHRKKSNKKKCSKLKKGGKAGRRKVKNPQQHYNDEQEDEEEMTVELLQCLYRFVKYGFHTKVLLKNEIRDVFYWILARSHDFTSKDTPKDNHFTSINDKYLCYEEEDGNAHLLSFADPFINSQLNRLKVTCKNYFQNSEIIMNASTSSLQEITQLKEILRSIYYELHELAIPSLEILTKSSLKGIQDGLFFSSYNIKYEIPKFHDLLDTYPFLKILQPLPEQTSSRSRKKSPSNNQKLSNEETTSNNDDDEEGFSDLDTSMEIDGRESEGRKKGYALLIDERVMYYILLLQRNLTEQPPTVTCAEKRDRKIAVNLFDTYSHLFQYLFTMRQQLNNMIHERVLYHQTKAFLHHHRCSFFEQRNAANLPTYNYFEIIRELFHNNAPPPPPPPPPPAAVPFEHVKDVSVFWVFHSYYLENIIVPYIEQFYSFLEGMQNTHSSSSSSSTSPDAGYAAATAGVESFTLEDWFVHSKAKDVYLFQIIPSSSLASSTITSTSLLSFALHDNIQFIKSILLLDYLIVIIETLLMKLYYLLQQYYEQYFSITAAATTTTEIEGEKSKQLEEDQEYTEKYLEIMELFSLYLINELNNYQNDSPSAVSSSAITTVSTSKKQNKDQLKDTIYRSLVIADHHHQSMFALIMAPRILFQKLEKGIHTLSSASSSSSSSSPSSSLSTSSSWKEITMNLHQSYEIYCMEEKNLTKKEKNSFLYFHFNLLYKLISRSLRQQFIKEQGVTEQRPQEETMEVDSIQRLFQTYFSLQGNNHNNNGKVSRSNYESIFSKDFVNHLIEQQQQQQQQSKHSHTVRWWKDEDCLWLLLCFAMKQLLEIRKRDPFHFQTQYRLAMIVRDLIALQSSFPQWMKPPKQHPTEQQQQVIPSSTGLSLTFLPGNVSENTSSSQILLTTSSDQATNMEESQRIDRREMQVESFLKIDVDVEMQESIDEMDEEEEEETEESEQEGEEEVEEQEEEEEEENLNKTSDFQDIIAFNLVEDQKPLSIGDDNIDKQAAAIGPEEQQEEREERAEDEDEEQLTQPNEIMITNEEDLPIAKAYLELPNISNHLLLNFLSNITMKKSFLEMHKLFERRYPQIIAMWHDQIPDNPWEKIIAQTSKFDAQRRKITRKYLMLGREHLQSIDPFDVYDTSTTTTTSSTSNKGRDSSSSSSSSQSSGMIKVPDFLINLLKYLLECKNVIFTATVHQIFQEMTIHAVEYYQILFKKYYEKLLLQSMNALQATITAATTTTSSSSSASISASGWIGKEKGIAGKELIGVCRVILEQLFFIIKDLENVYKLSQLLNHKRLINYQYITNQLQRIFWIFLGGMKDTQQILQKILAFLPGDVLTVAVPSVPSSLSSTAAASEETSLFDLSNGEKELLQKFLAFNLQSQLPSSEEVAVNVPTAAVMMTVRKGETEDEGGRGGGESFNEEKTTFRQLIVFILQIISQIKKPKNPQGNSSQPNNNNPDNTNHNHNHNHNHANNKKSRKRQNETTSTTLSSVNVPSNHPSSSSSSSIDVSGNLPTKVQKTTHATSGSHSK